MKKLVEELEQFRKQDTLVSIACLIDDLEAMRVIAVWPFVPLKWQEPDWKMPEEPNARWQWLCDGCHYDDQEFAEMAGMAVNLLDRKMAMLFAARLIFPDGTVREHAQAFVRNRIKKEMK